MNHHITAMCKNGEFSVFIACSCGELLLSDNSSRNIFATWNSHLTE